MSRILRSRPPCPEKHPGPCSSSLLRALAPPPLPPLPPPFCPRGLERCCHRQGWREEEAGSPPKCMHVVEYHCTRGGRSRNRSLDLDRELTTAESEGVAENSPGPRRRTHPPPRATRAPQIIQHMPGYLLRRTTEPGPVPSPSSVSVAESAQNPKPYAPVPCGAPKNILGLAPPQRAGLSFSSSASSTTAASMAFCPRGLSPTSLRMSRLKRRRSD
ncbi:hypothetical protein K438DRAFT_859578 [Mycena galopus ATCC 62051]|nr:hypothetical protein K438DRAFT_859578 [Mycena galopus ATCC 62051]